MNALARRLAHRKVVPGISFFRSFTMSAAASTNDTPNEASSSSSTKVPLALPPADSSNNTKLDMSNGDVSIKLEHLGPMIVNVDGTLSRISNWDKMADIEKENTLRIIVKRNQARLEVLKAKDGKAEGAAE
jgi:hypothetical protein